MIRAAAYCRVSTDRQDQANSFAAQQRFFKDYIQDKSDWQLYEIYADEGLSGTSTKKREAFQRMMTDALAGKFTVILTKEVSRFSRNILDTIACTRQLKAAGVAVHFLNDGFHTLEADAELKLAIMASLAQEESRRTGSRVSWGQQRQMERGVVFGQDLLGYRVRGGKLTIEPEGAGTVALIFRKFALEGQSMGQIARYLTEKGIPNRDGSTQWRASTLGKILRNEKYAGDLIQRKTYTVDFLTHKKERNRGQVPLIILKDHHEAIVSRELWEKAQDRLRENAKTGSGGSCHILSGKVFCGCCGSRFVCRQKQTASGNYCRWCCAKAAAQGSTVRPGPNGERLGCDVGKLLRDDDGLNMVKTALNSLPFDREDLINQVISDAVALQGQEDQIRKQTRQRMEHKKQAMLDSYFAGDIDREEMLRMKERYDERLSRLSDQPRQVLPDVGKLKSILTGMLQGEREDGAWIRTILESIAVFPDGQRALRFKNLEGYFFFS